MKIAVIFLLSFAAYLETSTSKSVNDDISSADFQKYLLWGHALANSRHNLIIGQKGRYDWLLNQKAITKSASWVPFMKESDSYNYNVTKPSSYITYIEVIDQSTNGKGGYATLVSGGPGYKNVSLSFESQRSQGLNFIVSVYGTN